MITLAKIARLYQAEFKQTYRNRMTAEHRFALQSLIDCRTPACGEMKYYCQPCVEEQVYCHSCGHRSCPKCQHQSNCLWLVRQQQKLLPVNYYMVTFTLPYELRLFVWRHQKQAYAALFEAAKETLNSFANHDKHLKGSLGMTAVLHTHSRRLEFHPHVHVIVPAGSFNKSRLWWHTKTGKYLFNEFALAKVFKAKFLEAQPADSHFINNVLQAQPADSHFINNVLQCNDPYSYNKTKFSALISNSFVCRISNHNYSRMK